jgi:hypothetical protein
VLVWDFDIVHLQNKFFRGSDYLCLFYCPLDSANAIQITRTHLDCFLKVQPNYSEITTFIHKRPPKFLLDKNHYTSEFKAYDAIINLIFILKKSNMTIYSYYIYIYIYIITQATPKKIHPLVLESTIHILRVYISSTLT